MSQRKSSPSGSKKGAARLSTLRKSADKKQARKRKDEAARPTKQAPKASKKVKGSKLTGNGMPMKRKDDSTKGRGGGVAAHRKNRKVASASAASVTLDAGPSRAALDDDRFLGRLDRIDQRLERIEDLLQRKAQGSQEHGATACSSRGCSAVDTQELKQPVVSEPVHEFDDDYEQQPLQASSTKGQANETKQAPISEPVDEFAVDFEPQPPQRPSTKGQSNESKQAPAPEPFDEFAETIEPQSPRRPSTDSHSSESKQAPDPEPFDEFAEPDEFDV